MKLLDEVPEWQRALAADLRAIEKTIDEMLPAIPTAEKAKCYVSLAYDWYEMGATAEGQKLVWKAEHICPGYFENEARAQMAQSPTFNFLMNSIAKRLKDIVKEHSDES